jgi:hypothetical protein
LRSPSVGARFLGDAHRRARDADERDRGGDAGAAHAGASDPPVLRRERLFLGQYADHHYSPTLRGRGLVPGVDLDLANLPCTPEGNVDFAQDFFGREAFLKVSVQLNIEAYCLALTKVYTFGPTYRAKNSNTSCHLAEFWVIDGDNVC